MEETVNTENKTEAGGETPGDDVLAQATKRITELEQALTDSNTTLKETVNGFRKLVLQANPDVPEELVNGVAPSSPSMSRWRRRKA